MKQIINYIKEALNNIKHNKCSGGGSFTINDNVLDYYDETTLYPKFRANTLEISTLHVVKNDRNMGIATKLLNAFIEFAKSENKDIVLCASPLDDNMTLKQLIDFYKKFGFKEDIMTEYEHWLIYKHKHK